ncbi:Fc receptor-like protein 2 isoform X5 [Trichechus manatus latirostris]|uniref:Fc receptor-like protein 2 isoform X5 n=1 Tax=Trichechus manatus latirostris TaxID=127582 RepID=A0A2Y9QPT3_TRIMA|nr:Fc receptor-like protein 2 isoform X5 [Trichechus manatus latirostris]
MLLCSLLVIFAPVSEQSDWPTLLAPSSVFEGDSIVLKCQVKQNRKIKTMSYYKDGRELFLSTYVSNFLIQRALFNDSGQYHCAISGQFIFSWKKTSEAVKIKVQELFPPPVLTVSPSQLTEGTPVTLTCETWLPPQRLDTELQFFFFREDQSLGPGWSRSPELQIPTIWSQDSGSYWCEAQTVTHRVKKQSLKSHIHVQRVPVANVSLETQPPGGQAIEGGKLVLFCSVSEGTGNITFSWHKDATETSLGNKTQHSLSAELEILAVRESDAGKYYCRADNGHRPIWSEVNVTVRRPDGYRRDLVIAKTLGGLFGVLGFVAVALLFYYWYQKTSGGSSAYNASRGPFSPGSQESTYSSPLPAVEELQLMYANDETTHPSPLTVTEELQPAYMNVGAADTDVVYSQVWCTQQTEGSANIRKTFLEIKDSSAIYSEVKKA